MLLKELTEFATELRRLLNAGLASSEDEEWVEPGLDLFSPIFGDAMLGGREPPLDDW